MTKKFTLLLAIVATALVVDSAVVVAQPESATPGGDDDQAAAAEEGFFSRFIDPYDGRLDFTAGGDEGGASGLVPLVIPGNDPTLGPNLLMAAVYFHPTDPSAEPTAGSPPTMTFGGAGITENESWANRRRALGRVERRPNSLSRNARYRIDKPRILRHRFIQAIRVRSARLQHRRRRVSTAGAVQAR